MSEQEETQTTVWEYLEQSNPHAPETQALYEWGLNCDPSGNPFLLYLDLIGWSDDNYGEPMWENNGQGFGYLELGYLADALKEYTNDPERVNSWVGGLMNTEGV